MKKSNKKSDRIDRIDRMIEEIFVPA